VDAGPYAADGKSDIALQHFGLAGFSLTKLSDFIAFHGASSR
jgi:hypothetical protein